jgi:hypothetical protein
MTEGHSSTRNNRSLQFDVQAPSKPGARRSATDTAHFGGAILVNGRMFPLPTYSLNMKYFEAPTDPAIRFTPQGLVEACYERDVWNVLFDDGALRPEFFDLSSGFAGDMVQKLANYRIRAGIVVVDTSDHSDAFREFVRESNRSGSARFFQSDTDAISWLSEA